MNVAIVFSNYANIDRHTKKGTEIFSYLFVHGLVRYAKNLTITAFASGASDVPTTIASVRYSPSVDDPEITAHGKHVMFELALLSLAFTRQDEFDLYQVHIGDGDLAIPFAPFVRKPIIITLHHIYDADHTREYFSMFAKYRNVFFISVSNFQRKLLPDLNYAATIYHGIDENNFLFNRKGSEVMMWAGRAIPEKGLDTAIDVAAQTGRAIKLFAIRKKETETWFSDEVLPHIADAQKMTQIHLSLDQERSTLVSHFQSSKLFLFPVQWEEPFGLVLIEAMACGTPVVAFARGSIPEVIKDGETGFIVNPSEEDIRGDFIIKKTGIEGLKEAVDRIYGLSKKDYEAMRTRCRARVEQYFTVQRMAEGYKKIYETILQGNKLLYGISDALPPTK